jgi:hypothetical protein
MTEVQKLRQSVTAMEQENHELRERQDGDRFQPSDTARDIARVIVGMLSPSKARAIASEIQRH